LSFWWFDGQGRSLRLNNQNDADITNLQFPLLESCNLVNRFVTPNLSFLPFLLADGLYVPRDPDYPAVDLIWKMQGNIWLVQVHVTKHVVDASETLKPMIESALKGNMEPMNLFLLYLSPRQEFSASLSVEHELPKTVYSSDDESNAGAKPLFRIMAKSMDMFMCFADLQSPNT